MEHITYYQPCAYFDDGTNIDYGNIPEELASFMVFRTREDCEEWLENNGYNPGDFAIIEYHDDDIEEPTFIDADGYYEDGTCSVSAYNTEKDLDEGFCKLRNLLDEVITKTGRNPIKISPVTLYEDDATLGGSDSDRPTIVSLDRYVAYDTKGRRYALQNISDCDDYDMLYDAVALSAFPA